MAGLGIKTVVAGAHTLDGRYNATREAVLRGTEEVNEAVMRHNIDISVLPGMELYLGFDAVQAVKTGKVMGLNLSRYLLVELPVREFPLYTDRALFELLIAGYRPILNHPERNLGIQRNPDHMRRLAEQGVGAAVTAASLVGRMGQQAQALARAFVEEEVATLVVSDAHNLTSRAPLLREGLEVARTLGKRDQAEEELVVA